MDGSRVRGRCGLAGGSGGDPVKRLWPRDWVEGVLYVIGFLAVADMFRQMIGAGW
jgi:hypothetical protein